VAIVESKYCAKKSDVEKQTTKKPEAFRKVFPQYKDYTIQMALFGLSFEDINIEEEANDNGVAILKIKGDHLQQVYTELKNF
jgi:hypothetical protein